MHVKLKKVICVVSITFTVRSYEKSMIPGVHILRGEGDRQEILIEISDKLGLTYSSNDKLKLIIGKTKPKNIDEKSYCGKAFLYSLKEQDKRKVYLFSVGGFIIRVETPRKLKGLEIAEEYNFCLTYT